MTLQKIPAVDAPLFGVQLIQASAGTGKTWTLSALFARLILERGLGAGQILAITFTKAAAAELRDRIRKRLAETLTVVERAQAGEVIDDPFYTPLLARLDDLPDAVRRLQQALGDFDLAAITTIHGFCQGVLAEQALASGAPLDVEVLTDTGPLLREIIQDYCRRVWRNADPALVRHVLAKEDYSLDALQKFVTGILSQSQAEPRLDDIDLDPALSAALEDTYARLCRCWQTGGADVRALFREHIGRLDGRSFRLANLEGWFDELDRLLDGRHACHRLPARGLELLEKITPTRLDEKRSSASVKAGAYFPPHELFTLAEEFLTQVAAAAAQVDWQAQRFRQTLVAHCRHALPQRLHAQQAQDFDMQIKGLALALEDDTLGPTLAAQLRERYPAALVDEFQDTDDAQYRILQRVYPAGEAGDSVLYLVGDPKQAIYRFRGADVYTYLRAHDAVPPDSRHDLADNQRSVAPLIDALNAFFGLTGIEAFKETRIPYTPVGVGRKPRPALTDHREGDTPDRQPLRFFVTEVSGNSAPKGLGEDWAIARTVRECVRLLQGAQDGQVLLGDRPLQGKDIAILVRSHYQAEKLRQALARVGVKAAMQSSEKVFASPEAGDMALWLAALAEPHHDGKVRAALASRLGGATVQTLLAWQNDTAGWTQQLQRFQDLHQTWQKRGFMVAWREYLHQDGVIAGIAERPAGERILTNLMHLAELLHEESRQRDGVHHLCEWLALQRVQPQDSSNAELRLESDENLVRILTIHASKGLEFPVVFAPMLWIPQDPLRGTPFYHPTENGPGVYDLRRELDPDALELLTKEVLSEDLRVGYVALTRAAQRAYVAWYPVKTKDNQVENSSLGHWLPQGVASLQALCAGHPERIAIATVPEDEDNAPIPRLRAAAGEHPPALAARPAPPVPAAWRLTSFSALNNDSLAVAPPGAEQPPEPSPDLPAADHDRQAPVAPDDDTPPETLPLRFRFPQPARIPASVIGNCLHGLFEHLDFQRSALDQPEPQVERTLQRYGLLDDPDTAAPLVNDVGAWLDEVLATELAPGLRLNALPAAHTLRELDFHLPLPGLRTRALVRCLRDAGLPVPELQDQTIRGFLKGSIDLVFRHEGRWYIADYKSNRLGADYAAYGPEGLAGAMVHGGYHLQAALYSVALHRWLQSRLRDYDPARHLGGVYYLFIRGMHPARGASGVHAWQPPTALLDALSTILADAPETLT